MEVSREDEDYLAPGGSWWRMWPFGLGIVLGLAGIIAFFVYT